MRNMIQSKIDTPITLLSNDSAVSFQKDCIRTNGASNCNSCSWLCHTEGNPLYKINKSGRYHVNTTLNVSSATAGVVAFGIFLDGIKISEGVETIAAGDYANISVDKTIPICQSGTLTIQSIPTVVNPVDLTGAAIITQIPIILSGNLQIDRDER